MKRKKSSPTFTYKDSEKAADLLNKLSSENRCNSNPHYRPDALDTTDLGALRKALWDAVRLLDDARRERDTEHQRHWKTEAGNIERISQLERERSTLIGAFKLVLSSK
jgi:hypothetical protein